jgi:hypothetical protein
MLDFRSYSFVIFCFYLLARIETSAQCCSPGNPVGGTANLSIVTENKLRMNTYFRFGYADTYFEGSRKSDFQFVDNASYSYLGTILTYGLKNRVNIEAEFGYYFSRTQNYKLNTSTYSLTGSGLKDGVFTLKYNLYKNALKELEFTGGLGAIIPFRKSPQDVNNVQLPIDVQPSDMAYGIVVQTFLYKGFIANGLHLFQLNRYEYKFENPQQYQFGQALYSSLFISKALNTNWSIIMQIRNEWRQADKRFGKQVPLSGGDLLFIAPQLNYSIRQKWSVSVLADMPVYRNYSGTQLSPKFALAILISREFDFSRKTNDYGPQLLPLQR